MFNETDYIRFCSQLLEIEKSMEEQGKALRRMVEHPTCQQLLDRLIADEQRHEELVRRLLQIIRTN